MNKKQINIITISTKFQKCDLNHFTNRGQIWHSFNAILNQIAEPGNSTNLHMANTSTPKLNRAIFVCSTRTPQEFNPAPIGAVIFLSMVACSGKGFALCCVPYVAVFQPVTRYRPSLETSAVTSKNQHMELSAMIYLFKAVSRLDLRNTKKPISSFPCYTVRISAESLDQAKATVCPFFVVLAMTEGKNAPVSNSVMEVTNA